MAERALPPGTAQRRSFFGLLDADGWSAATLKALLWFVIVMFALGYVPNAAYYFVVGETVDVGANIISPVNLCDPANETLPCPAPRGALVPWQLSPSQLALPAARTSAVAFQSGTNVYLVGGSTAAGAVASVLATTVTPTGNLAAWTQGPALPEPRANAALTLVNGVPYVIGGLGADGKPATTVFVGAIDKGSLTGWTASTGLLLPVGLSGASAVVDAGGIWLIGGRTADGISAEVYRSALDATAKPPVLGAWKVRPEVRLHTADGRANGRTDAVAAIVNDFIYLVGGQTALGPSGEVLRLQVDAKGEPVTTGTGSNTLVEGWGAGLGGQSLPEARVDAAGFANNGAIYVVGGLDGAGAATATTYWAVPDPTRGDIAAWQRLAVDDLRVPSSGAATVVAGAYVFALGGSDAKGPIAGSERAYLAPRQPFFRMGLIGMTVPGLAIKEEIGVQLGEIAAASIGVGNFVLLIAAGVLLSRPRTRARFLRWVSRGRYRLPPDDGYSRS